MTRVGSQRQREKRKKYIYIHIAVTYTTVSTVFPIAFGIPECTINFDTLDLFFGRPDDHSIQLKHVAIRIFCIINCCV
jgi:hypothetical protein